MTPDGSSVARGWQSVARMWTTIGFTTSDEDSEFHNEELHIVSKYMSRSRPLCLPPFLPILFWAAALFEQSEG